MVVWAWKTSRHQGSMIPETEFEVVNIRCGSNTFFETAFGWCLPCIPMDSPGPDWTPFDYFKIDYTNRCTDQPPPRPLKTPGPKALQVPDNFKKSTNLQLKTAIQRSLLGKGRKGGGGHTSGGSVTSVS